MGPLPWADIVIDPVNVRIEVILARCKTGKVHLDFKKSSLYPPFSSGTERVLRVALHVHVPHVPIHQTG